VAIAIEPPRMQRRLMNMVYLYIEVGCKKCDLFLEDSWNWWHIVSTFVGRFTSELI
jgi:hypothetical protein